MSVYSKVWHWLIPTIWKILNLLCSCWIIIELHWLIFIILFRTLIVLESLIFVLWVSPWCLKFLNLWYIIDLLSYVVLLILLLIWRNATAMFFFMNEPLTIKLLLLLIGVRLRVLFLLAFFLFKIDHGIENSTLFSKYRIAWWLILLNQSHIRILVTKAK
jgi:hypothetical protein